MYVFLLSSLFLHLIGSVFTLPEVCNPIECFHVLDTFFQRSNYEFHCEKITTLERCARLCAENKTDPFFLKGLAELKNEICKHDYESENKCANKHKFRLISCIYEKFHLEADAPDANDSLLMCRRAFDGAYCDEDSLPLCTDRESFLSKVLLVKLFEPLRNRSCGHFSFNNIYDLKLKPMPLMKDYNSLAECLDVNSPYVTDCTPKKWIATNFQQKGKLCSDVETFFNCVEGVVEKKCNTIQKSIFTKIRQPVFSYLLPHCTEKDGSSPLKSPVTSKNFLNEVYSDSAASNALTPSQNKSEVPTVQGLNKVYSDPSPATTSSPLNISEVVVVHQHVVITMTYKDKNAANQIYVCFYLIAIAILFGIWKEF